MRPSAGPARWLPGALGLGSAVAVAARLFLPSPVGTADNGDYARALCVVGLDRPLPFALWVPTHLAPGPTGCGSYGEGYGSSLNVLLRFGRVLTETAGGTGLDLRWFGLFYVLAAGLLAGIAAARLPAGPAARTGIAVLVTLVTADSAVADWAMSVFGESPQILGMLLLVAGGLLLHARTAPTAFGLALLTAGGVLACAAKAQSVVLAVAVAVLLAGWLLPARRRALAVRGAVAVAVLGAVLTSVAVAAAARDPLYGRDNGATLIFSAILPNADDPARAVAELGLPPSFVRYRGSTPWGANAPRTDPDWSAHQEKVTQGAALRYFRHHPRVAWRVAGNAARAFFTVRVTRLGNHTEGSGAPPRSLDRRVLVMTTLTRWASFLGLPGLLACWLLGCATASWLTAVSERGAQRAWAVLALALAIEVPLQFAVAAFGDGLEPTKHLQGAIATSWLALVALVGAGIAVAVRAGPADGAGIAVADGAGGAEPAGAPRA